MCPPFPLSASALKLHEAEPLFSKITLLKPVFPMTGLNYTAVPPVDSDGGFHSCFTDPFPVLGVCAGILKSVIWQT